MSASRLRAAGATTGSSVSSARKDLLHQAVQRQHIELPRPDEVKTIVYDGENAVNAVKLAAFFRNSGIAARILPAEQADGVMGMDSIIASPQALERYGIK